MANYSGSAANTDWIYSGGTVALDGDFRNFSYNTGIEIINTTAGADADATHIVGVKSGQFAAELVQQVGGTAIDTALQVGTQGTLEYSPEGTAVGKRKFTIPATVTSFALSQPYNDIVSVSAGFERNGSHTLGTN